jgi:hypothetical protein
MREVVFVFVISMVETQVICTPLITTYNTIAIRRQR